MAESLAECWITIGDFLLHEHPPRSADFVVGNPPYIRLESVPAAVMDAYRRACPTMRGRSDIYVGFIEQGAATAVALRLYGMRQLPGSGPVRRPLGG